jgi:plasmid maintenance system antidote protein VapI
MTPLISAYFGNSAKFWLGLQNDYDIENEMSEKSNEVKRIIGIRKDKEKDIV